MLQRLLIALSQVKAGKISENLLNEIRINDDSCGTYNLNCQIKFKT